MKLIQNQMKPNFRGLSLKATTTTTRLPKRLALSTYRHRYKTIKKTQTIRLNIAIAKQMTQIKQNFVILFLFF